MISQPIYYSADESCSWAPVVSLRIRPPDAGILVLQSKYKVKQLNTSHQLSNIMDSSRLQ